MNDLSRDGLMVSFQSLQAGNLEKTLGALRYL